MRNLACVGIALALLGCGGSKSAGPGDAARNGVGDVGKNDAPGAPDAGSIETRSNLNDAADAARDLGKSEVPGTPDTGRIEAPGVLNDATDGAADVLVDGGRDLGRSDVPDAPDTGRIEAPRDLADAADTVVDLANSETPGVDDTAKSEAPGGRIDATDGARDSNTGEECSCAGATGISVTKMSWGCFCSVENCGRTLADFVDFADGGKVLKSGNHTVLLREYVDCNLVLVQAKTYSDYMTASEYVFNRATGALVGARVWLDDREHLCPFSSDGGAHGVLGYESGSYPVPASCHESECLAAAGACPSTADAL